MSIFQESCIFASWVAELQPKKPQPHRKTGFALACLRLNFGLLKFLKVGVACMLYVCLCLAYRVLFNYGFLSKNIELEFIFCCLVCFEICKSVTVLPFFFSLVTLFGNSQRAHIA